MNSCKGVKCDKSGLEFPIYIFLVIKRVAQIRCAFAEVFQEVYQKYHYSILWYYICRMSAFVRGPMTIAISCNFYIVISVQRHLVALHEDIYMKRLQMAYSFLASTGTRTWLIFPPCRMNKLSGYPTFSTLDIRQLFPSIPGTNNSWMHLVKTTENHPPVCTTPHWHCTRPSHQHLDMGSGK